AWRIPVDDGRFGASWLAARRLLHWLLLGVDGTVVCRRRDEHSLDRGPYDSGAGRKSAARRAVSWARRGIGRDCRWWSNACRLAKSRSEGAHSGSAWVHAEPNFACSLSPGGLGRGSIARRGGKRRATSSRWEMPDFI